MTITTKLSSKTLIAYGGLAMPVSMAEFPILAYLPAFYAKEVGLSAGLVGLVFLLARLWDGVTDPLIGGLSDRGHSRFGRRKPWVVVGAGLLMVATWFLCVPPEGAGVTYLAVWAVLFYTAFTLVAVPYRSWGAEMTPHYEERSKVTAFREGFAMVGNILVGAAPLVFLTGDAPVGDALFLIALMIVVLVPITAMPVGLFVKDPQRALTVSHPLAGLKRTLKNGPFRRFLLAYLGCYIAIGITNSLALFLFDIGLGLGNKFYWLLFIQYVIGIAVAPLTVWLANRLGKHTTMIIGFGLFLAGFAVWGIIPDGRFDWAVFGLCFVAVGASCLYVLPTSILADIIDYDTAHSGEEAAGLYNAVFLFLIKIGLAAGVGIAYTTLDLAGFDPATAARTAENIFTIKAAYCGLATLFMIPAILVLWKFPITKAVQQQLRTTIDANKRHSTEQGEDSGPNGNPGKPHFSGDILHELN